MSDITGLGSITACTCETESFLELKQQVEKWDSDSDSDKSDDEKDLVQ